MRRLLVVAAIVGAVVGLSATAASAHPLGNFSVNHYDGLIIHADRVDDLAVLDTAELPTQQQRSSVDRDGSGAVSVDEARRFAALRCVALAAAETLRVDGVAARFAVQSSSFAYRPGAAGLHTSRLTCRLTARVRIDSRSTVDFGDGFEGDRIGWHEITANAVGVHLSRSPVPQKTVSDELRHYPNGLLTSPLNVRSATMTVLPGAGTSTVARDVAHVPGAGPVARWLDDVNRFFDRLVGARHLTVGVGLLAVLLAVVLGASHAALPGHGKTVMAAYLAGRRGSVRDAVTVGATVTATHTGGVLLLGMALTLSASLAGEDVTRVLGVVSGLLVATVGIGLLVGALRHRGGHHDHHDHPHGHDHDHPHGHDHDHPHGHDHGHPHRPLSRAGLVGMGVAGGLVPSPSALVVLLGAVALGRTVFGVLLVLAYGMGMAGTLTAVGLVLVRLRDRFDASDLRRRLPRLVAVSAFAPVVTAGLVFVVGLGLAASTAGVV